MPRALHLMIDHVFTRDFIEDAKNLGCEQHDFLVYGEGINGRKFIDEQEGVYKYRYGSNAYRNFIKKVGIEYTHLFVHWLSYEAGEAVINAPSNVKTGSFFWGNDFAEPISEYSNRVFEPLTLEYYNESQGSVKIKWRNNPRWRYAFNPRWLAKTLVNKFSGTKGVKDLYDKKKQAVGRLDYFFHFNKYDLEWVNVQTPTNAQLVPFFYGAGYEVATLTKANNESNVVKIIVGNSSSPTNNHLDVIQRLSNSDLPNSTNIISPLSYGDKTYRKRVIAFGKKRLGDKFIPLVDYMPRDEYFKLLAETRSAIFNVRRTQALGNINAMIAMGKSVFLNTDSPIYKFFVENGFTIFSLDDAYKTPTKLATKLEHEIAKNNQNKLQEYFSETLRYKYLKDILEFKGV